MIWFLYTSLQAVVESKSTEKKKRSERIEKNDKLAVN